MVKREECFKEALERKKTALENKKRRREALVKAVYSENPELQRIDRELVAKGANIALTALSGDLSELNRLQGEITALSNEKKALLDTAVVGDIEYECGKCYDTGYVGGKVCECVKELAKKIAFERLSSEMPLEESRFDNFNLDFYPDSEGENGVNPRRKMAAVLNLCREYAKGFSDKSENLLFLGDSGLGKTHLTLAIVSDVLEKGFDVIYGSAYNLLSAVEKEHFSKEGGDSYETMLAADLLVIDDLGTEFTSAYTLSVLYNLINSRLLAKKPTIINTNLSLCEIEKRYTPRIASRLIGCYTAKKFFGRDVRQIKAMKRQ